MLLFGFEIRRRKPPRPRAPEKPKRLIFVLGSQRSGTNALRQSLSLSPFVMGFNETQSSELYEDWKLRPEPEIRQKLHKLPNTVLLKPIKSVIDRAVAEFLADFHGYDLSVVWIYRDPVKVFSSQVRRWSYMDDPAAFVERWNRVNRSALEAAEADPRVLVVRYEDLIADKAVFGQLCRYLRVRGEYLFQPDRSDAYRHVDNADIARIQRETAETLEALDGARAVTSMPPE